MKLISLLFIFCLFGCAGNEESVIGSGSSMNVEDMPVLYDDPGIFKKYNPSGASVMNTTWTKKFDASGISFNDTRTCTLITPQHVVMAAHYKRAVPSSVVFHDRNGRYLHRVLKGAINVIGDCAVGLLNEPVPAAYKIYPLLNPEANLGQKLNREFVLVTDKNKRVFVHQVRNVTNSPSAGVAGVISFLYDQSKQIGYGKMLEKGDSGNPSFVMVNGEPVLIETHHTGGAGSGPFYGDAILQQKLRAAIRSLGGKGMFRTVSWRQ